MQPCSVRKLNVSEAEPVVPPRTRKSQEQRDFGIQVNMPLNRVYSHGGAVGSRERFSIGLFLLLLRTFDHDFERPFFDRTLRIHHLHTRSCGINNLVNVESVVLRLDRFGGIDRNQEVLAVLLVVSADDDAKSGDDVYV